MLPNARPPSRFVTVAVFLSLFCAACADDANPSHNDTDSGDNIDTGVFANPDGGDAGLSDADVDWGHCGTAEPTCFDADCAVVAAICEGESWYCPSGTDEIGPHCNERQCDAATEPECWYCDGPSPPFDALCSDGDWYCPENTQIGGCPDFGLECLDDETTGCFTCEFDAPIGQAICVDEHFVCSDGVVFEDLDCGDDDFLSCDDFGGELCCGETAANTRSAVCPSPSQPYCPDGSDPRSVCGPFGDPPECCDLESGFTVMATAVAGEWSCDPTTQRWGTCTIRDRLPVNDIVGDWVVTGHWDCDTHEVDPYPEPEIQIAFADNGTFSVEFDDPADNAFSGTYSLNNDGQLTLSLTDGTDPHGDFEGLGHVTESADSDTWPNEIVLWDVWLGTPSSFSTPESTLPCGQQLSLVD